MKKLSLALSVLVLLLLTACKFNSRQNDCYVKLSANIENHSRTALPEYDVSLLQNITLSGKTGSATEYTALNTWSSYTELNSDSGVRVEAGDWNFKLSAEIGGYKFQAEKTVTISEMETSLHFTLELTEATASSVAGKLSVLLTYPYSSSNNVVKVVTGQLYAYNNGVMGEAITAETVVSESSSETTKRTVAFELDSVAAGKYFVKLRLYADTAKTLLLNDVKEIAVVYSDGITSTSAIELSVLDSLYSVSLYDDTTLLDTLYYTKRSGITLPNTYEKNGYCFNGWKAASTDTAYVTQIVSGTTGDKTYYADWETGVAYSVTEKTQNLDGITYAETTVTKWGRDGSTWTVPAAEKEGFTVTVEPETISLNASATTQPEVVITYDRKTVTWTYKINSTDSEAFATVEKLYGTSVLTSDMPANPTSSDKTGYHFEEWIMPEDYPENGVATYTDDYVFVGKWHQIVNYTISYVVPEYAATVANKTVPCEGTLSSTYLPTLADVTDTDGTTYTFAGWYDENGNAISTGMLVTGDMELYARFASNIPAGAELLEVCASSNKQYDVWTINSTSFNYGLFYFNAKRGQTYTISWGDGYSKVSTVSDTYQTLDIKCSWATLDTVTGDTSAYSTPSDDGPLTITPTKDCVILVKVEPWTSGKTGSFVTCVFADLLTEYTVTYSSTYSQPASKTIVSGLNFISEDLPVLTQEGYRFKGWYTSSSYTTKVTTSTIISSNMTLYAKWEEVATTADNFVYVEGGTVVGSSSYNQYSSYTGAFPYGRTVTLSDFYISPYEVTKDLYSSVMEGNDLGLTVDPSYSTLNPATYVIASGETDGSRAVEGVTWYDAVYFCNLYSEQQGYEPVYTITNPSISTTTVNGTTVYYIYSATVTADFTKDGYRLPTEAEWEYAARGGAEATSTEFAKYYSGATTTSYSNNSNSALDSVGWYGYNTCNNGTTGSYCTSGTAGYGAHEVGLKAENPLGLYDMSGNVWEWCWDWYGTISTSQTVTDPTGASSGAYRVARGGSWSTYACYCAVSCRGTYNAYSRYDHMGFRLVRSAQ